MESVMNMKRRHFVAFFGSLAAAATTRLLAEETPLAQGQNDLVEPVHRVANAAASLEPTPLHPLDRALNMARSGLKSESPIPGRSTQMR